MPKTTRGSEYLAEPDNFHPAALGRPVLSISVLSTAVNITRIEGWYGKAMRGQKVLVEREYDDVSQASLRRLGKAVSKKINDQQATIQIDQVAGFMCYEVEF